MTISVWLMFKIKTLTENITAVITLVLDQNLGFPCDILP